MKLLSGSKPNILLISFDALRRSFISVYGGDEYTDVLERAAGSGIVFTNAIANGNWTVPSHASLFTGQEPQAHRIFNWRQRIPKNIDTIFCKARRSGYRTAFLASEGVRKLVDNREEEFEVFDATRSPSFERISDNGGAPWCILWHFLDTHAPYNMIAPRAPNLELIDYPLSDPTINYLRELICTGRIEVIKDQVRHNLRELSKMVQRLWDQLGQNTVVALFSDHGEDWQPFRPFHCSFEVPVLKIPLIVSAPGLPRVRDDRLVSHADVSDLVWCLAVEAENERADAYTRWQPRSDSLGRVAVCGPDSFDNKEVFLAACTSERMIVVKPSTTMRRYFIISGAERQEQSGKPNDPAWTWLNQALDKILDEYLLPSETEPEMSSEDTELLLDRLEKLGYI